jgi:squalene synthase HpnC
MSAMITTDNLSSGKGHADENFPVASFLIHKRHRPIILAFYRFARGADDVADHPQAPPDEKLRLLDEMQRTLDGDGDASPVTATLRSALARRNLSAQPAQDLLEAFRRDVTKLRYENWDELMDYCRYSAMPVGRFVLDVHDESQAIWPLSDALCAALQVINHLQDCGKDYRELNRVYLPLDMLAEQNAAIEMLGQSKATAALRCVIATLAHRTSHLLADAAPFAGRISDRRLGLEVSVIQRLAEDLATRLLTRDPLSERVHHRSGEVVRLSLLGAFRFLAVRRTRKAAPRSPASTVHS